MTEEIIQVPVHILDQEYVVACPADEQEELRDSARLLDRKMREVRDNGKVVGTERIAVIAALNMAHELIQSKAGEKGYTVSVRKRLREMQAKIESVLTEDDRQLPL